MAKRRIAWALGLAMLASTPALGQQGMRGTMRPAPTGTSETYIVTLTANGVVQPSFAGSDKAYGSFFPSLGFRRSDEPARFAAADDGISISFIDNPTFRVGPVFRIQSGRYLEDDRLLFGLKKRNFDVESGLFIEYWPLAFIRMRAEARHGFQEDSGFAGLVGVDFVQPFGRFVFSVGPRGYFGDTRYHDRLFGVRPAEALLNGRVTPYSPTGGVTAAGVTAALTYQWNETWSTTGYVNYRRLLDEAAASPIVKKIGSADQLTVGARLSYSFAFTPWW